MEFVGNIATILLLISAGLCLPVDQSIELSLRKVLDHGVVISWRGPKLQEIKECDVTYQVVNSTISQDQGPFQPLNNTIELDDLLPLTAYQLHMVCQNEQNVKFHSKVFNFTTVGEGSTLIYPVTDPVTSSSTTLVPSTLASSSTHPPVLQEKITSSSSALDLALGVLFGFVGAGVLATLAYFLLKKYRRQQRIRRFLQYRQQENETFTDLDQEEDEGVVV